jgi:hypothetical protein
MGVNGKRREWSNRQRESVAKVLHAALVNHVDLPLGGEAGYNPKRRVGVFAPVIRGAHEERGTASGGAPL